MKINDNSIAILITTILRDELYSKTIRTIINNLPDNCYIIVGEQTKKEIYSEIRNSIKEEIESKDIGIVISQEYDIGISESRNQLVEYANKLGFKYVIISADSIQFTEKYDFSKHINKMKLLKDLGIIGFHLNGSLGNWYAKLDLIPNLHFKLTESKEYDDEYLKVDIVKNFFIAKIEALLACKWDKELALAEHEDFFYRFKSTGFKVYYYSKLSANHESPKEGEYSDLRSRCYNKFKKILMKKYGLHGWVVGG